MFGNEFFDDEKPKDLASEIDTVSWQDLVRHFAFGRLYIARSPLTLLEAAEKMKADDARWLKAAMENRLFGGPSEAEATLWHTQNQSFEVLVISPFVIASPTVTDT